jgi:hypothetical protein
MGILIFYQKDFTRLDFTLQAWYHQ